jgi:glyoxylase-like metal-dependent hydrolase (beta-lactamase superfamily II)
VLIHPLDLCFSGYAHTIASYLVDGPDGPVLVETGPTATLETLKARLADHGYAPPDIRHVLVTHIHLDHAGAAGWWAQHGTRVYVHHRGAPHLVDPSRLLASAARVYGDGMAELWGEVVPAPPESVTALHDGDQIAAGGLTFVAIETPGHASHHMVFRLGDAAFTGDIAGIRLPGPMLLELPTPPPDFDLELWVQSLDHLAGAHFSVLLPTHYGPVEDVGEHLAAVRGLLIDTADFVRQRLAAGVERGVLIQQLTDWRRERGALVGLSKTDLDRREAVNPAEMCVDGLIRYWRKAGENRD